ncbi:disintegrin and metalloproteinase domain-containing protein 5-like [Peromyscus californicus insignis]|uniref:disintegrin and metalloproteinase domain-containing protein 5-like n=1 Tax=Peromyscus californicus insignis TaxID=564181 RepID=UPI0022A6DA81|nr:disintegrin and metalloproteinase domain-containing protein 5-like [Peromyscus californicus insignis]
MFLLLVLFTGLSGLQAGQSPQKTILQTTIPEKISSSDMEEDPENHIAYLIKIAGKPYFAHLEKQSVIAPTAVLYTFDQHGNRHAQPLSFLESCTYSGYIAGFPNSLVTLSVCSGLRGTIQFPNSSYGIEPVEAMSGFVHVIYEITNEDPGIPVLEENEKDNWYKVSEFQFGSNVKETTFIKLSPQYIEVDVVVDKKLFDYMGSDAKIVTQKVIQVIGLVNTMFSKFKLTVLINSIEIWSKENIISLPKRTSDLFIAFLNWKRNHKPHISYLFVFEEQPASIGALSPGEVCRGDYDAAVALYPKDLSLESYSVIVTQLLSLGMGLTYDNTDTCHCMGDVCLMTSKAIYSRGVKDFSTCSLDEFKSLSMSKNLGCLRDWPMERRARRKPRRICGNGIIEGQEQCDCGTSQNCTHRACCDPLICRLKPGAVCGSGGCCTQNCKIKAINSLCRKKRDECDFAEYCNGTHASCVPDTFVRNGEYCNSGEAFCYEGECRYTDRQCLKLLGKGVRGAPFWCFEELNSRGDRFGNCVAQYCRLENVLCGKLVCTWPFKYLFLSANMSAVYTHARDDICISLYRSHGIPKKTMTTYTSLNERDETFVEDGVICGPEMYCMETVCKERRFLTDFSICNVSRDCSGHGTCNNFHHCHCDNGYVPPNCEKKIGQFGSIDDGHHFVSGKSFMQQSSGFLPKQRLQLIFYISLPAVIIITAVIIKQSKLRQLCYREGSDSDRSTSEDSRNNTKLTTTGGSSASDLPVTPDSKRILTVFTMKKH